MIHIIFGAAAAGSLKQAIREMKQKQIDDVIAFDDIYSIGPLLHLHEHEGQANRIEWLRNVMSNEFGYFDDMVNDQHRMLQQIKEIKAGSRILIWTGSNAHEQIGLRYAVYLLKEKRVELSVINITTAFDQLFNTNTRRMILRHSGEIASEKFKILYESKSHIHPVTKEERERLQNEWVSLAKENHTLRIWQKGQVIIVPEDEFDAYLVKMAKRLHQSAPEEEYIVTPRLIGEVIGHLDQYIGDDFIEYRLKTLIDQGMFDMKGKRTSMRYYSIKLTEFGQHFKKWVCCREFEDHPFVKIEGDYGSEPFHCGHCQCHLERDDVPMSDTLFSKLWNWNIQYGRWFDEETDDLQPNGVDMERKFNQEGERITEEVKRALSPAFEIEYSPSEYTQYYI
ncbi:DUF1835 domain-containing protein [Bacillus safensis]|nr:MULTISPECIES: DUF1835 domain-containing protein [Bacillus]MBW4850532.1 DUF1835 domain-containing protein [Bacillaceae bacterium]MBW4852914.1 DUF1835 domain-containing protein [Bacillaceae bacterium]MBW4855046.1 DUF1835 domain-containing protein [Bacillaceae bacterium]MCK1974580.1 DUF1835 domain-containing protein [Bacillus safensis]MCY7585020.1 DUF1835 domain-containing protein [Bacillus safensis]